MCSPKRLLYLIKYGIAYVNSEREIDGEIKIINQKHVMRYQQFFASLSVTQKLDSGVKSGIIWHTQGSGKTALSFHLSKILTDYYSKKEQGCKILFYCRPIGLNGTGSRRI